MRLQNRAVRIINFANYRDHADPIFKNLSILKIIDNVELQNMLLVYDSLNYRLPSVLHNIYNFSQSIHNYKTRNSLMLKLSLPKVETTAYGLNSIEYKSIKVWNKLIDKFPCIKFQDIPRSKIKNMLLQFFLSKYI